MALLNRYDPPAFLTDYNEIPGQLDAWHRAVSRWFDQSIGSERQKTKGPIQFYNAATFDPGGLLVEQAVTWNAFPKELIRRFGRDRALLLADTLWPVEAYETPRPEPNIPLKGDSAARYRPQEEYCEWHVLRDPDSNKIQRVTFTSEPPEYWMALYGSFPSDTDTNGQPFPGSHDVLLRLYRDLVNPGVQLEDLLTTMEIRTKSGKTIKAKQYNIRNKWNTTHGIVHLTAPPNFLTAEIQLGADASVHYLDPQGRVLVEPDALIAYAGYGGPNRNSDPTIGASVNALSRLGAYVTLQNPVGLYMDHIDLSGWFAPDGKGVSDCTRIMRGTPGMIERLVVEVPENRGFSVGEITINGVPILFGGQIAECITVKLIGLANVLPEADKIVAIPAQPQTISSVDPLYPSLVNGGIPPGAVQAFVGEGAAEGSFVGKRRVVQSSLFKASKPSPPRRILSRRWK